MPKGKGYKRRRGPTGPAQLSMRTIKKQIKKAKKK